MNGSRITTFASVLLIAALIMGIAACDEIAAVLSGGDMPQTEVTDGDISITHTIADLPIESVSVAILESVPTQVNLEIEGYLADSCTTLHETTEQREGDTIHVQVTTIRPIDLVCATVITEIEHTVPLGFFDPGVYKVVVNGITLKFEVH